MAIEAFTDIRLGKQSVAGTPVPATVILDGVTGVGMDDRKIEKPGPKYSNGRLAPRANAYTGVLGGQIEMDGDATFDGILYALDSGIHALAAPATAGTGGHVWTASVPTVQGDVYNVNPYTIEADGQGTAAKQLEYAITSMIELAGKPDGSVTLKHTMMSANYQLLSGGKTPSLPYVNYETIVFNGATFFIDDATGTLGTTDISTSIVDFGLKIATGLVLESGPGSKLTRNRLRRGRPVVTLDITFDTEVAAYLAEEAKKDALAYRLIRMAFPGSLISAGTPNVTKLLQIDLGGRWDKFDKLTARVANQGAMSVKGSFTAGEQEGNPTSPLFCNIAVTNTLATLT